MSPARQAATRQPQAALAVEQNAAVLTTSTQATLPRQGPSADASRAEATRQLVGERAQLCIDQPQLRIVARALLLRRPWRGRERTKQLEEQRRRVSGSRDARATATVEVPHPDAHGTGQISGHDSHSHD